MFTSAAAAFAALMVLLSSLGAGGGQAELGERDPGDGSKPPPEIRQSAHRQSRVTAAGPRRLINVCKRTAVCGCEDSSRETTVHGTQLKALREQIKKKHAALDVEMLLMTLDGKVEIVA